MESKQEWHHECIGELIKDGFYDKLIIIGFPYDEGAKRNGARGGSDYGPGIKHNIFKLMYRFIQEVCKRYWSNLESGIWD